MGDDGFQIVKMRLPSERGADPVGSRYDVSGITRPSARELDLEISAGHAPYGLNYLEHGKATAVAAIDLRGRAAAPQIRESVGMCAHQIGYVNIVADAGAIGRRIVGPKDFHFWP